MGVIVVPWKRGSRTRLYVKDDATNDTIGWVDANQLNGELLIRERAVEYVAALYSYSIPREATIKIVANSQKKESIDLSNNLAGAAARAKAEENVKGMSRSHAEIVRALGYSSVEQTWIQGAEGEELVGRLMDDGLNDGWRVLHSVPIGSENSDIDHLLIGPGGVFTVNTKNHPGSRITCAENKVRIEGSSMSKNQPYARNSRFEAKRTSRVLSQATGVEIPVLGIVAFIALQLDILSEPRDGKVKYLSADHLVPWLNAQNRVYSNQVVDRIWERARWSDTWQTS